MTSRSGVIQTVVAGALAFVGGLVVGGMPLRAEVRALEDQVFELEKARSRRGSEASRELAELITQGVREAAPDRPAAPPEDPPDDGAPPPAPAVPPEGEPVAQDGPIRLIVDDPDDVGPEDVDSLQSAKDLLRARAAQARAALFEDARPSAAQEAAMDEAIADMNDELYGLAQDLVDDLATNGEPNRRDMMRYGADVLDILVTAEDRMIGSLDADQVAGLREEATDPSSFVDPAILDVLQSLEGTEFGR